MGRIFNKVGCPKWWVGSWMWWSHGLSNVRGGAFDVAGYPLWRVGLLMWQVVQCDGWGFWCGRLSNVRGRAFNVAGCWIKDGDFDVVGSPMWDGAFDMVGSPKRGWPFDVVGSPKWWVGLLILCYVESHFWYITDTPYKCCPVIGQTGAALWLVKQVLPCDWSLIKVSANHNAACIVEFSMKTKHWQVIFWQEINNKNIKYMV